MDCENCVNFTSKICEDCDCESCPICRFHIIDGEENYLDGSHKISYCNECDKSLVRFKCKSCSRCKLCI